MLWPLSEYNSVPEVLRALIATKPISIRQLSRKLGYASDRTVGMVVQGQRDMAPAMLRKLGEFAKFSAQENEFVRLLAERDRLRRRGEDGSAVDALLGEFRKKSGTSIKVQPQDLSELSAWFAFPVIEVLGMLDGQADARAIRAQLRGEIALKDLKKTLAALVAAGFIKSERGVYSRILRKDEYVGSAPDIPSVTIRAIHRKQLERAMATLEEQSVGEREFISKTLIVPRARLPELKKKLREVLDEVGAQFIAPEAADGVVVQLNSQLYQQSRCRKAVRE